MKSRTLTNTTKKGSLSLLLVLFASYVAGGGDQETKPKNISAVPMIFTLAD